MAKHNPVDHSIAVCERFNTHEWVICNIYYQNGKGKVEYENESNPITRIYVNNPVKVIELVF